MQRDLFGVGPILTVTFELSVRALVEAVERALRESSDDYVLVK